MDGIPTVTNAGYTGADFTYKLGSSVPGETFSYLMRLSTEPAPTSPADFETGSPAGGGIFRRRLQTGSCSGTLPVEDNEVHTVRVIHNLFVNIENSRKKFHFTIDNINICFIIEILGNTLKIIQNSYLL